MNKKLLGKYVAVAATLLLLVLPVGMAIWLAYSSLVAVGNNQVYFTGLDSPTYVFSVVVFTIFIFARSLLMQLA